MRAPLFFWPLFSELKREIQIPDRVWVFLSLLRDWTKASVVNSISRANLVAGGCWQDVATPLLLTVYHQGKGAAKTFMDFTEQPFWWVWYKFFIDSLALKCASPLKRNRAQKFKINKDKINKNSRDHQTGFQEKDAYNTAFIQFFKILKLSLECNFLHTSILTLEDLTKDWLLLMYLIMAQVCN